MPEGAVQDAARPVERRRRAAKVGVVVSDRMQKTVVVAVEMMVRHPAYKRIVRRTSRFLAHDDRVGAHVGDQVEIVETRPLSRLKRWRVSRVITRATDRERARAATAPTDEEERA